MSRYVLQTIVKYLKGEFPAVPCSSTRKKSTPGRNYVNPKPNYIKLSGIDFVSLLKFVGFDPTYNTYYPCIFAVFQFNWICGEQTLLSE